MNLKYLYLVFITGLLCIYLQSCSGQKDALLIINMSNEAKLPNRFRSSHDTLKNDLNPLPSTIGLFDLNISASGQFSEKSLQTILQHLNNPPNFYILDLRQESHGFLNGNAVSWYLNRNWENNNKSITEIEKEEQKRLKKSLKLKKVSLYSIVKKDTATGMLIESTPQKLDVTSAMTERELAHQSNLQYLRLEVVDHLRPTNAVVDQLVNFATSLPNPHWIHIHCSAGKGRATTFMVLYDIIFNAKTVSIEDIIHRQWLLGGLNLFEGKPAKKWKAQFGIDRLNFVQEFYVYCRDNQDNYKTSWSEYLLHQNS